MKLYVEEFFEKLSENPEMDKQKIANLKIELCRTHKEVKKIPTDIELLLRADPETSKKFRKILQTKPNRSLSGVTPVAIMTSPHPCPHGKCTMCPGGLDSPWGDKPQSYTGSEPATMRGERAGYDAYLQVFNRLEQYMVTGHVADKVDLIIMGGTFTARDISYQNEFITDSLKAMNDFSERFFVNGEFEINSFKEFFELPGDIHEKERILRIQKKILKLKNESDLQTEQKRNEKVIVRCIGMTIETRPDWGFLKEGNIMLEQGTTRIELGIQSVYDKSLESIKRGHSVADNKKSISILKDLGFKLNFHMMLGLPEGNNILIKDDLYIHGDRLSHKKDLDGLKELFIDPDYRPDMIKLYPLMVMPGTILQKDYEKGLFNPISTSEAAELVADFLPEVETYCRVMRVQRDIPSYKVLGGVDKTNLRQYVDKIMKERGSESRDIRARETGRKEAKEKPSFVLVIQEYEASGGIEFFISMEDLANDAIAGFCRMRFPGKQLRKEITPTTAIIRELHVYGSAVGLGNSDKDSSQHKGFGKKLMAKAEEIAKKHNYNKMIVISGIGVKEYYRNIGYSDEGPYVGKKL